MTILAFILWVVIVLLALNHSKDTQSKNKVHFYITRDKIGNLILWLGKPYKRGDVWEGGRKAILLAASYTSESFNFYKLKVSDYDELKWEDEPVEVFLNLED